MRLRILAVAATAAALLGVGGVVGIHSGASVRDSGTVAPPVDRLSDGIKRTQDHLRRVPGDWVGWSSLAMAYVEQARVTADPSYYPKAEGAAERSLRLRPHDNAGARIAQGALANARHDFTAARDHARAAIAVNGYDSGAYAVLADAETQLGHVDAATEAVQRLLDLRPGLSAYARGSYDLEQRGQTVAATDLMRRALAAAVDPHDIAFCRNQLGDLAFDSGDLAGADREYTAGLTADPSSAALRRGRARVAAAGAGAGIGVGAGAGAGAGGHLGAALAGYADVTRRAPTPSNLLEYAELLRAAGRYPEAAVQLELAQAAHTLFTANGGVDGLTAVALAEATGRPEAALREARAEFARRQHADVADALGWALHLAGQDAEALRYARRATGTGARAAGYAYHLGLIELSLGDQAAARTHLTEALRINPYFSPLGAPLARQALAGLARS